MVFLAIIVTKKAEKLRYCFDCQNLNQKMKDGRLFLPKIEQICDSFQGATVFASLELFNWYLQILL